jgi:hypothetical protein
MRLLRLGFLPLLVAVWATIASAVTITFTDETTGAKANGFTPLETPLVHFTDSMGADLSVTEFGVQSHGNALRVGGDDASALIIDFDIPVNSITAAFGNDDPIFTTPTDEVVLRVFNNLVPAGESHVEMNRNDEMDQTIAFSGATFDRATIQYAQAGGSPAINLIEILDDITVEWCGDGTTGVGEQCDSGGDSPCCVACEFASSPCSTGNPCTVGDACAQGVCAPGSARTCEDGDPCTFDSCDPVSGCDNPSIAGYPGVLCAFTPPIACEGEQLPGGIDRSFQKGEGFVSRASAKQTKAKKFLTKALAAVRRANALVRKAGTRKRAPISDSCSAALGTIITRADTHVDAALQIVKSGGTP